MICLLDEQKTITDKGGTMRLGAQPAQLAPGSKAAACYGATEISERHRHRYEFNNVYRQQFAAHGMQVAGTSPDGSLVEIIEIARPSLVRRPCSSIRSSSRSRPRRIRCSPASSPRRSSGTPSGRRSNRRSCEWVVIVDEWRNQ